MNTMQIENSDAGPFLPSHFLLNTAVTKISFNSDLPMPPPIFQMTTTTEDMKKCVDEKCIPSLY